MENGHKFVLENALKKVPESHGEQLSVFSVHPEC